MSEAETGPEIPKQRDLMPADASEPIVCTPKLEPHPDDGWVAAAERAVAICPGNAPPKLFSLIGAVMEPGHLAVMTSKYWGPQGVHLTVGFMDNPTASLRAKLLLHMNAWGKFANVVFVESAVDPQVRIARQRDGYWSYLGTDILGIPKNQQTMNLEGFTDSTPESEFYRVVRHETGHTLGFPHEHLRAQIVARIDPAKAIAYFQRTQGWSASTVRQQVLTPLEESSIRGTPTADTVSIMTYQLPGSIMRDGQPIQGGNDIDALDAEFVAKLYPLAVQPPPNPPPPPPPPPNPPPVSGLQFSQTVYLPDGTAYGLSGVLPKI